MADTSELSYRTEKYMSLGAGVYLKLDVRHITLVGGDIWHLGPVQKLLARGGYGNKPDTHIVLTQDLLCTAFVLCRVATQ